MWGPSPGTDVLRPSPGSPITPGTLPTKCCLLYQIPQNAQAMPEFLRQCQTGPDTYSSDHRVLPNDAEISSLELLPTGPCSAQQTQKEQAQPFHKGNCERSQNSHSTSCQFSSSQHMALDALYPGPFLRPRSSLLCASKYRTRHRQHQTTCCEQWKFHATAWEARMCS